MKTLRIVSAALVVVSFVQMEAAADDFFSRATGAFLQDHVDEQQKRIVRSVKWIWEPLYPEGAPYALLVNCDYFSGKNGKAVLSNILFTGLDDGTELTVPGKVKARIRQGFGQGRVNPDLSSLSSQSAVLVEAKIKLQKDIGPDETVRCNVNVLEFGPGA